jgi:hypothetical protein
VGLRAPTGYKPKSEFNITNFHFCGCTVSREAAEISSQGNRVYSLKYKLSNTLERTRCTLERSRKILGSAKSSLELL